MKNIFFNKYDSGKPTIITNNLFKQKILKSFIKKYKALFKLLTMTNVSIEKHFLQQFLT